MMRAQHFDDDSKPDGPEIVFRNSTHVQAVEDKWTAEDERRRQEFEKACERAPHAPVQQLLDERNTTHGKFEDNAAVGQWLRNGFRARPGWASLTDVQREALDMIACKVSRVLSGQGGHADHWDDIAGYAKLAAVGRQP